MEDTLGFVDAAAAAVVDSHRRDGVLRLHCSCEMAEAGHGNLGLEQVVRSIREEHRTVFAEDKDMVGDCKGRQLRRFFLLGLSICTFEQSIILARPRFSRGNSRPAIQEFNSFFPKSHKDSHHGALFIEAGV